MAYTDVNNTAVREIGIMFYGPIRYRFLKMNTYDCLSDVSNYTAIQQFLSITGTKCFFTSHVNITYDKSGIQSPGLNHNYNFSSSLNITHETITPIGTLDSTGTVVDMRIEDLDDYDKKMSDLRYMVNSESSEKLLNESVQAIELNFNIYDPTLDVFVSNLFLVQRDVNQLPTFTIADSIPFITNVYEKQAEKSLQGADVIRIILLFFLLTTIPIRMIQKYYLSEKKGCMVFFKIAITVTLQMKNLLLVFSVGFLLSAYSNFSGKYINTESFYNQRYFFDFYDFAYLQKEARSLDQLSMYLVTIYSFKYLQFFSSVQILFIAFKKTAFEYFSLLATICVLFMGLSILTNFVFGSYIYEYKNFIDSVTMNIKIFIFIENTSITGLFLSYYRVFSIIVLIIFIFLIRFFLLNLFYPIFIEYYRVEVDKVNLSKSLNKNEGDKGDEEEMTIKDSKFIFIL
jgi:hypothetical protein